jgi:hypothetical protein
MSILELLIQTPLLLLALLKELVIAAALLYIFVIYPKPTNTGFYSRSTSRRLLLVATIVFFPVFFLIGIGKMWWAATQKLRKMMS